MCGVWLAGVLVCLWSLTECPCKVELPCKAGADRASKAGSAMTGGKTT